MVKLCQIAELYKNFEKYVLKRAFFIHKTFSKSNLKLEKSSFKKWQNSVFSIPYIARKTLMCHEFARAYLYLVHIMQNIKGIVKNIEGIFGIYEVAKWRLIKTHLWKNLQKLQKATILPWIGTEASNFQVKFPSRVAFNNW